MTVTSTIGSASRNYSTIAGWEASLPSTLADAYVGQCYNDSEFLNDHQIFTGHTTTAAFNITLTAAPGQSFIDNANVQTNALAYNQANGVGIRSNQNYTGNSPIQISDNYVTVSRLQIKHDASYETSVYSSNASNITISQCIIVGGDSLATVFYMLGSGSGHVITNNLILSQNSGVAISFQNTAASTGTAGILLRFNTIVAYSDKTKPSAAVQVNYGGLAQQNNAIFGFTNLSAGITPTYVTTMTDIASPPAGCTTVTYANQFVGTTSSAPDFRQKSGANLRGAATADSTYGALDIVGTARPNGGNWDIGAWEYVATAGAVTGTLNVTQASQTRVVTGTVLVSGTLAITQASQTLVATGTVAVAGTLSRTQDPQTLLATGLILSGSSGNLVLTQVSQTLVATGTVTGVAGGLGLMQADQTLVAAGVVSGGVGGGQQARVMVMA